MEAIKDTVDRSEHICSFMRLTSPLLVASRITDMFVCEGCQTYHVCDGSSECHLIETHDGVVCAMTGRDVGPDLKPVVRPWTCARCEAENQSTWDPEEIQTLLLNITNHLYAYFRKDNVIPGVQAALFDDDGVLRPHIPALISFVFPYCLPLMKSTDSVRLIVSLYIHVIIAIYSRRTIYGCMLFKSMRNKKTDLVAKRMREAWMSTLTTKP
ncbi:ORF21 [callitrichine gammaherpesvirus 3]|uniref:ORF21 n=1 Tax=callitrichine gammaherpesvirus 3 TaxID=106331 RepID=Q993I9_9GAMA|nr:ORF21 [callitrichine gammaherpesvirus 3]AAK38229.1 ORF21 [callitrichine gammaherpesvirus 3]